MDKQAVTKKISELMLRRNILDRKIVEAARAVVPVLKDAGQKHSAEGLDRLFFEYDALTEEMATFARENMVQIIEGMEREAGLR